jgi:hypothetical protein
MSRLDFDIYWHVNCFFFLAVINANLRRALRGSTILMTVKVFKK